jgi:thiamine biosynthesis lipoprotein
MIRPSRRWRLWLLLVPILAPACVESELATGRPDPARLIARSRVTMGSLLTLTAWTADEPAALTAFEAVFDEFDRLDALMSVWKEGSDIVRLNEAAGRMPVPVHEDVRSVLQTAIQIGDWTDGKFDVTFAALADVWKFDHDQDNRVPSSADIAARLPLVDYSQIVVDHAAGTAFVRRAGMRVHVGGIGKGFAVDRGVRLLRSRGLSDFMIQSGGDMYIAGRHDERPWRVGIRDPRGPEGSTFATLEVTDVAVGTSGDYERFFIKDGRRYHHLLDPDTGQPARAIRSVTVIAPRAVVADALGTGVFVAGPQAGMKALERMEGVQAVIVTAANDVIVTPGLRGSLALLAQPTDAP